MKIHVLPQEVFNKIAAGEVVDRPYSVVKELVENAIDAGATAISVETEGGGKTLIRVTDNGGGIGKDDLVSAYLPHATSKLQSAEDLFGVTTLGFRGEAIASIASVSKMKIVSRTEGGDAFSLSCLGGKIGEIVPAAGAQGTEVTVEELFFNTPARLKFLKSDAQEEGDVANMMARFILSRPEISFTYTANGKIKYRSYGDGLSSAIANVYGADILDQLFEIDADKHGIKVHGFIGNQNFSKPNRTYQSLFVNGRYVVNQTVSAALTNAYASYLMKRQYPFYVLFLDVPPEIVDVNVTPNKSDVRFADNQIIYGSVYSVVSAVLDGNSRALEYLAGSAPAPASKPVQEAIVFEKRSEPPKVLPSMTYEEAKKELEFDVPPIAGKVNLPRRTLDLTAALEVHAPTAGEEKHEDAFEENKKLLLEQEKAKQQRVDVRSLRFKGELFRTYLFYESGDDAYIVDQHAAHERLIYDKLRAKLESRAIVSQPMLVPFVLTLNGPEFAFVCKQFPILEEIGFEVGEFGGNSIKVSAVPSDLMNIDLTAFFGEIVATMESLRAIKLADLLKDKLASAACKAAVKGGEFLTEEEAAALLERMDGDMGLKCPHGRPVAVHLKKSEMEKLFKRIV